MKKKKSKKNKREFLIVLHDDALEFYLSVASQMGVDVKDYICAVINSNFEQFEERVDHRYNSEVSFKELLARGIYS